MTSRVSKRDGGEKLVSSTQGRDQAGTPCRLRCYWAMAKKFYSVVVVRSVEESTEVIVEADSENQAHGAALSHLAANGDEYVWGSPRRDLIVWHKREIATPAIIDVTA